MNTKTDGYENDCKRCAKAEIYRNIGQAYHEKGDIEKASTIQKGYGASRV